MVGAKVFSITTNKIIIILLFTIIVLLSIPKGFTQEIKWYTTDQGGGISTDNTGDIKLTGVIGQVDVARMKGDNLSLSGGYLPIPPLPELMFKNGFE